ncbi:MAG: DNA repair protein RadA [Francisellaceae bacterium]|jgi:DNA repair protein RadA/Sms|nr:DNA repair protein RadA [Francisellaceae bacterium]MBT6207629.1 DNA repair protein RadA [Francisellaceae bacterium]MBT6537857.1 DNA repair protein RadA [Francisellaceae bacterium]
MSKTKLAYLCSECGSSQSKWSGQCLDCGKWNSLSETVLTKNRGSTRLQGYSGQTAATVENLESISIMAHEQISSGIIELDRVLGGGLVKGSVVLIGGDPGIGKSTLLLQSFAHLSDFHKVLYITGEESLSQVKLRATRLSIGQKPIRMLAETNLEAIMRIIAIETPDVIVMDSIQTCYTEALSSAPGTVSQIRECAGLLVRLAKQSGISCFLVGHITKDGQLAGPRVLEHMVDTVLYFESGTDSRYRMIRAIKNRFGAVGELGILAMTEKGLQEVKNASAIFLSSTSKVASGRIVTANWEGNRPLLVEIQALIDETAMSNPKRLTVGLDQNRLALILAVLNRHAGIQAYRQDVFVNVVGGIRITETAIDLPVALAIYSSLKESFVKNTTLAFGEVGLSGEIRAVQSGQPRLKEAAKLGFTHAIVPKNNTTKQKISGIEVLGVSTLQEAITTLDKINA